MNPINEQYDRALAQHSMIHKIDLFMLLVPGEIKWLDTDYQEGFYRNYMCKHCNEEFGGDTQVPDVLKHMERYHQEVFVMARMAGI